jgi:hypothetical protein
MIQARSLTVTVSLTNEHKVEFSDEQLLTVPIYDTSKEFDCNRKSVFMVVLNQLSIVVETRSIVGHY